MCAISIAAKAAMSLAVTFGLALAAAEPAEARKRKNKHSNSGYKSVSCCKVYGIYQPRMTHTSSRNERFFKAISYNGG